MQLGFYASLRGPVLVSCLGSTCISISCSSKKNYRLQDLATLFNSAGQKTLSKETLESSAFGFYKIRFAMPNPHHGQQKQECILRALLTSQVSHW